MTEPVSDAWKARKPEVRESFVLPLRATPQPMPPLHDKRATNPSDWGDCGPCCLGGLLQIGVKEVYDLFRKGEIKPLSQYAMLECIWAAWSQGLVTRIMENPPLFIPKGGTALMDYGLPSFHQGTDWFKYVACLMEAGLYGLATVSFEHKGPHAPGDHWVLLVGHRTVAIPAPDFEGCWSIDDQLLISNSSTRQLAEEWVSVGDFLRTWGGFNAIFVKPKVPVIAA